ncbi:MAG: Crp/Fnr family transcriptional regulator, partial [Sphingobacterium sp.]
SSKSIKCVENTVMLCISYENLQVLYDRVSEGQKMGRIISEELFLQATVEITSFYVDTPEQRYQKFLTGHPNLNRRLPQYLIASYLKIKPQSLSRIRNRMFKN